MARALGIGASVLLLLPWQALSNDVENTSEPSESFIRAQEVYEDNCAECHGLDGVPRLPGVANFAIGEQLEKNDSELLAVILGGKGDMPEWRDILTTDEQGAALAYLRLFSGHRLIEEKCSSCHDEQPHELLKPNFNDKALRGHNDTIEICSGSDVEAEMNTQDFTEIDRYRELLAKLSSAE